MHSVFRPPLSPTYREEIHGPHVCDIVEQEARCKAVQFGALEQFTVFSIELLTAMICLVPSALPELSVSCCSTIDCNCKVVKSDGFTIV